MKVSINKEGVMLIESENGLESYALHNWCIENDKVFNFTNALAVNYEAK